MNELIQQIKNMSRQEVLEAASFAGDAIITDSGGVAIDRALLKPLTDQPFENLEDIEQLARITLITAALTQDYEDKVRDAITGAGSKNFVLGPAEVVALVIVAIEALRLVITKGEIARKKEIVVTREGGKETVKITEEVQLGLSPQLGSILRAAVGLGGAN